MLHSCGRHYGGQIVAAQQCHPYASYANWDGSCRGCPGNDEKEEEEAKEGSKFLGATMVANWEEAAIWALRQVDGRTPTRGPAIILQFHKNAPRNVRRVTKQGGPENPAARHKFPESLGTRPEACCDVETSFQWWQKLNPAIWLPGGQDYHRQVSSRCVPGHSWWAEGRGCHLPDNTRAMERDCQWILEEMERPPCLCSSRWEALCHKMSTEQRISLRYIHFIHIYPIWNHLYKWYLIDIYPIATVGSSIKIPCQHIMYAINQLESDERYQSPRIGWSSFLANQYHWYSYWFY